MLMSKDTESPPPPPRSIDAFSELVEVMRKLRTPVSGCPWDLEQTFATIAPYTIEEAYEVADAIERRDYGDLKLELGDLLFQSVFHAQIAADEGLFDIDDVVRGIVDKMVARHPHVFGNAEIGSAADQTAAWERMKEDERAGRGSRATGRPSAMDDVANALPALMRAQKLTRRAARVGFDWPSHHEVIEKLHEELGELLEAADPKSETPDNVTEELGDILFVCANLCRKLNVDAEDALRAGNRKFEKRFRAMELLALEGGTIFSELSLDQQEALWQKVKAAERGVRT